MSDHLSFFIGDVMRYRNIDGGPGSGNWGHAGRPGERGGSASASFYNPLTGKKEKHGISSDKDKDGTPKRSGRSYRLSTPEGGWTGLVGAYKEDLGKHPAPKKAAPKTSFKDVAKELNDKCRAEKRRPTMEECKEVGKHLVEEYNARTDSGKAKEIADKRDAAIKEYRSMYKEYGKLPGKDRTAMYAKLEAKYDEIGKLAKELDEAGREESKWLTGQLSKVRELGFKGDPGEVIELKGKKGTVLAKREKLISDALSGYPTAWIEAAKKAGGRKLSVSVKGKSRSYYSPLENSIHLTEDSFITSCHEVVHWFEHKTGRVAKAEKVFYDDRTKGESLTSLKKLTGGGYKSTEMTKPDKFVEPYMGKDYGGHAYELLSMGCEYAYTQPHILAKDPDMQAWVFGCLACL